MYEELYVETSQIPGRRWAHWDLNESAITLVLILFTLWAEKQCGRVILIGNMAYKEKVKDSVYSTTPPKQVCNLALLLMFFIKKKCTRKRLYCTRLSSNLQFGYEREIEIHLHCSVVLSAHGGWLGKQKMSNSNCHIVSFQEQVAMSIIINRPR